MPEFRPITGLIDLELQDDDECNAGYHAGFNGQPEPIGSTFSRAYWHGWRMGMFAAGRQPRDEAAHLLATAAEMGAAITPRYLTGELGYHLQ